MNKPIFHNLFRNSCRTSVAGYGCASVFSKANFSESECELLLNTANDGGINMFDSGPSYGDGLAETRLGNWISSRDRSKYFLSTKVGTYGKTSGLPIRSFDPKHIEKSLSDSLRRLRTDYVDVLYLHGPSIHDITEDVIEYLINERQNGRIRFAGVNSFEKSVITNPLILNFDVVMLQYNVVDRSASSAIKYLKSNNVSVMSATALGRAIYNINTFLPIRKNSLWYIARAIKSDPLFPIKGYIIHKKARAEGIDGITYSLKFLRDEHLIDGFYFGTSKVEHMNENIDRLNYLYSN